MWREVIAVLITGSLLASVSAAQDDFRLVEPPLLDEFVAEHERLAQLPVAPPAPATPPNAATPLDAAPAPPAEPTEDRLAAIDKALKELKEAGTKLPKVVAGGVLQAEAGVFSQDIENRLTYGDIQNGAHFRRVRMSLAAQVTDNTKAFIQMDFGFPGRPTFLDIWGEINLLPVIGNFRIGQWKQPFSLEAVSSGRFTTFIERSVLLPAFTPFRRLGAGAYDHNEDLKTTWAASIFATGQDQFGGTITDNGGVGFCERFTWLPYYDEASEGRHYLHLGAAHMLNAPPNNVVLFRSGPEFAMDQFAGGNGAAVGTSGQAVPVRLDGLPFFVSARVVTSAYNLLGQEVLWVNGRFSFQGELMTAIVDPSGPAGVSLLPGCYGQVGYFLTGEHRPYNRELGQIDRVIPFENFFRIRTGEGIGSGTGAFEVASRMTFIDLNDGAINGGQMLEYTAGLTWYWNPNMRCTFNYLHTWVNPSNLTGQGPGNVAMPPPATNSGPLSDLDTFCCRLHVDF